MNTHVVTRVELLQSFEKLKAEFGQALADAKEKDQKFEQLRDNFRQNLTHRLNKAQQQLPAKNPLAQQVANFVHLLEKTNKEWDEKVAGRDKGVKFREGFNDSLLVFVYGKVKSGKSSLGNYVAWGHTDPDTVPNLKQSAQADLQPQYFSHERTNVANGDTHKEAEQKQEFRVGATEATSSIQGFRLAGLTWVDSPGLHSVNEENGQLAKDYVEHADLILYTMKSDAPGRETDLSEINELFNKDKKTLLLVTGSDTTEEDENEQGEIIQTIVMKPADTRAKQRDYVRQALPVNDIEIISFSARYAQEHENEPTLFQDSGMGQFFDVLLKLVHAEGVSMKKRVPMNNFKNFVADCKKDIQPYGNLLADFEKTVVNLQQKLPQTISVAQSKANLAINQAVSREFDGLGNLDDSSKQNGIRAAQKKLNQECQNIVEQQLKDIFAEVMSDFQQAISHDFTKSDMVKLPEFSVEMKEQQIASGVRSGTKGRNSGIGAFVGGVAGAFFGGPAGAALGATVGSLLGGASGQSASVVYETIQLPVADNFQEIRHTALVAYSDAVQKQIANNAEKLLNQVLQEAKKLLQDLSDEVQNMELQLQNLHQEVENALKQM
ncbi:MAG: dynamin family protein [Conchiformibius sp.]|nr:dynamin family protein [Conchiformibius sp.]